MAAKKTGLGKGLDLIFQDNTNEEADGVSLKINEIEPNRDQPRKEFNATALRELAESINKHGVLQAILVRPMISGGYQIVAGERRWRAAKMAGLKEVPVVIRDIDDSEYMQIALIENLQREDLNPYEEAMGYQKLIEEHGFTQEKLADSVGKSRPAVTNSLRLLTLPQEIAEMLQKGIISSGHARTLLGVKDQSDMMKIAKLIEEKELSVRQVEELQKQYNKNVEPKEITNKKKNPYFIETELSLETSLGRKVQVDGTKKKGTIKIEFYGEEDLKNLLNGIKFD